MTWVLDSPWVKQKTWLSIFPTSWHLGSPEHALPTADPWLLRHPAAWSTEAPSLAAPRKDTWKAEEKKVQGKVETCGNYMKLLEDIEISSKP